MDRCQDHRRRNTDITHPQHRRPYTMNTAPTANTACQATPLSNQPWTSTAWPVLSQSGEDLPEERSAPWEAPDLVRLPLHVAPRRHRHSRTSALAAASSMPHHEPILRLPSSEHSPLPLLSAPSPPTPSNNLAPDLNANSRQTPPQPQAGDRCRHEARPTDSSRPTLLPTPSDSTHPRHRGP